MTITRKRCHKSILFLIPMPDQIYMTDYVLVANSIAQLVKNPPAMQETPVRFLGWEDPLEKG